jgi:omega-amidase
MENLRVSAVQTTLIWEDPAANIQQLNKVVADLSDTDLIVLPEMFTTGFTMQPEQFAEPHGDSMVTLKWMKSVAAAKQAVICGSVSVSEGGYYYNRLYWVFPDGSYDWYDKVHLFSFGNEPEHYQAGTARKIFEWRGWKVLPLTCYDLRFPELARNSGDEDRYDLCLYVANWPAVRSYPWQTLIRARAIENQCYLIGVNRVGADGNGEPHSGDSAILDPRGAELAVGTPRQATVLNATLDSSALADFRKKFPVLADKHFEL